MISVKQYKNHLVEKYDREDDTLKDKKEQRKQNLESKFSDEELADIIYNTYSFAKDVLSTETILNGTCKMPLEENTTMYVKLGLEGGRHSDTLYIDAKGRLISKYIARQIFGGYFFIDLIEEEQKKEVGDNVEFYSNYYLYMQGFPEDIDKLKVEIADTLDELDKEKEQTSDPVKLTLQRKDS